jgi:hypothetical protein
MAYSGSGGCGANSWLKVAAGARLVASAFVQQSTKETSVVTQRIVYHGGDLSSKARQTVGTLTASSSFPHPPSQEVLWSTLRKAFPSTNIGDNNNDNDTYSHSRASNSGTGPYESQLRKKRQQQQEQENSSSDSLISEETKDDDIPNPYLFHYQPTPKASSSASTNEKLNDVLSNNKDDLRISNSDGKSTTEEIQTQFITASTIALDNEETETTNVSVGETTEHLREGRPVPSSRVGRAFGFASLGAGLAWGAVGEIGSRVVGGGNGSSNVLTTDANADRLAATLCRMRGAALKMGQMLSIQDESLLPPALTRALKQVRQGADAMPNYQLVEQLRSQLGDGSDNDNIWREKFVSFDDRPFAAASIGQVHRATVIDKDTGKHIPVVVKVQYPGVANSIESDLGNLAMLVKMSGLAPKGLFIENVIRVGRDELKVSTYMKLQHNAYLLFT